MRDDTLALAFLGFMLALMTGTVAIFFYRLPVILEHLNSTGVV
jgi:hypothetical protein